MSIPLIASSDTTGIFTGRVNQAIGVLNQLTDGVLTVNGSIIFSNTTFALSLPSLAVANSLIMTQATGNSIFLQSSGLSANGIIYAKSSGTGLIVSNNSIFGGNLNILSGIISSCNEIQSSISSASGQFRAIYGNYGTILRNDGINFYILTTGNVGNPSSASFNSLRPFSINVSTGSVSIDGTGSGGTTIGGNLNVIGQLNSSNCLISGNLTIGSSGKLTVAGAPTFNGQIIASNGLKLSNSSLIFDTAGTNKIQYNSSDFSGTGGIEVTNNLQINGKLNVVGTSNFTDNSVFNAISSTNLTSATGTFTNLNGTTAILQTANISSTLTSMDLLNNYKEIRSYGLGADGSGGQYRAIQGNYGVFLRNDGLNFNILQTANTADPSNASWNSFRPFGWNLSTGEVTIDNSGNGVKFGGSVLVTTNASRYINITSTALILSKSSGIYGTYPSGNITLQLGLFNDKTTLYSANSGFSLITPDGSSTLIGSDNSGKVTILSNLTAASLITKFGGVYAGTDNTGIIRTMMSLTGDNWNQLWMAQNGFRVNNFGGSTAIISIANSDGQFNHAPSANAGFTTTNFIKAGSSISSNWGYVCKAGTTGGFRINAFNIDWNGAQSVIYIDSTPVAVFANGTNTSDRRIKTNIRLSAPGSLDRVNKLTTYLYRFKDNGLIENDQIDKLGFIADELQRIIPQAVFGSPDAVTESGMIIPQGIDPTAIIAELVNAVKELSNKYDLIDRRLNTLENK